MSKRSNQPNEDRQFGSAAAAIVTVAVATTADNLIAVVQGLVKLVCWGPPLSFDLIQSHSRCEE